MKNKDEFIEATYYCPYWVKDMETALDFARHLSVRFFIEKEKLKTAISIISDKVDEKTFDYITQAIEDVNYFYDKMYREIEYPEIEESRKKYLNKDNKDDENNP